MKCQNNQKLSEVLWVMTTSSWIIQNCSVFIFFPPDLLPDPVQAVFTIQTRTSAPSTTTWSLQRAAAWRRNPPRSQTRRCSSCSRILSGLCAWTVICLHDGVSVMCLYPSTCAHFHLLEFHGNSAFSLSAVRCFVSVRAVHTVSFSSVVHLSAFSLRGGHTIRL